jgi:hypothetical protein
MPNVRVTQPSVIKVRVGTGTIPTATEINYGGNRTLKSAPDLDLVGVQDGDVITYVANTNSFEVVNAGTLPLDLRNVDAGTF